MANTIASRTLLQGPRWESSKNRKEERWNMHEWHDGLRCAAGHRQILRQVTLRESGKYQLAPPGRIQYV